MDLGTLESYRSQLTHSEKHAYFTETQAEMCKTSFFAVMECFGRKDVEFLITALEGGFLNGTTTDYDLMSILAKGREHQRRVVRREVWDLQSRKLAVPHELQLRDRSKEWTRDEMYRVCKRRPQGDEDSFWLCGRRPPTDQDRSLIEWWFFQIVGPNTKGVPEKLPDRVLRPLPLEREVDELSFFERKEKSCPFTKRTIAWCEELLEKKAREKYHNNGS
jgi:hypothetical protein